MDSFNQNNSDPSYGTPYQPPMPNSSTPYQPPVAHHTAPNGVYFQPQSTAYDTREHALRRQEKSQILSAGFGIGSALVACLMLQVFGVLLLQKAGHYDDFESSFMFQHAANILLTDCVGLIIPFSVLALIMKSRFVTPVVPRESVPFAAAFSWVGIGLCVCLGANLITNGVIELFKKCGYELTQYESLKPAGPLECVMVLVSTAIAPAVCEEFAMRCVSLGILRRHGKPFAVFAVSVVFGLLHGNVIQFVFAFIIGLVLAYATIMTDSVVPAIFIHGLNNGLSCINDIVKYAANEKTADYVVAALIGVMLVCGIIGLIYLLVTKQLLPKKQPKQDNGTRIGFGRKLLLLMPGMLLPFIILIAVTVQTVKPIQ